MKFHEEFFSWQPTWSHLNVFTLFVLAWGMLRIFRCVHIFLLTVIHLFPIYFQNDIIPVLLRYSKVCFTPAGVE